MTFRCQSPSVHFQLEGKSVLQRGWLLVPSFLYKTLLALLKEMKGVLYSDFSSVVSDFLGKYNLRWTFALFQNRFFVFLLFIVQVLTGDLSTIRTWPINVTRYFRHLLTKWFFWCCPRPHFKCSDAIFSVYTRHTHVLLSLPINYQCT